MKYCCLDFEIGISKLEGNQNSHVFMKFESLKNFNSIQTYKTYKLLEVNKILVLEKHLSIYYRRLQMKIDNNISNLLTILAKKVETFT